MKISSKGKYAIRFMLDLAVNHTGAYIPLKVVSKRQDLSEKFLEQTSSMLCKAGFVKSVRGAGGGYQLAKEPKYYTVGMILKLTERALLDDYEKGELCGQEDTNEQTVDRELEDLSLQIEKLLNQTTLEELAERYQQSHCNNYVI